jgi:hypothetical protein
MSFLKTLSDLFAGRARGGDETAYWIAVRCKRCGEVIRARVNLYNDLSVEYGGDDGQTTYMCRKLLTGNSQRCFQAVEVILTFDASRRLMDRQITGGAFVDA